MSTSGFELYTTGDGSAGQNLILRLERLRAFLQPILGEQRDERRSICIISFASREEFQQYAPISRSIGYFLAGSRRDFMVLDGASSEGRAAGHEFVHLLMARNGYSLPPWLNEGLAELYSNLEEETLGQMIPGRLLTLKRGGWFGLSELVMAGTESRLFTSADSVDAAYAESWLLAHMLVLDPRYAERFPAFLAAIQASDVEEAFHQVYGKSLAEVESDLRAYLDVAEDNVRKLGDPPQIGEIPFQVESQANFEGRMALADMLGHYRGRVEESRELYQQLAREYPQRF